MESTVSQFVCLQDHMNAVVEQLLGAEFIFHLNIMAKRTSENKFTENLHCYNKLMLNCWK